jgi:hypothetical protein
VAGSRSLLLSIAFVAPALLGAWLPAAAAGGDPELEASVREILARPVDGDLEPQGQRCLARARFGGVEIMDDQRIVFVGRGDQLWLNQLRTPCFGLRPGMTIEMQGDGVRLCRGHDVYGTDPSALRDMPIMADAASRADMGAAGRAMQSARRTARCSLGGFEPIAREQLQLLRGALRAR